MEVDGLGRRGRVRSSVAEEWDSEECVVVPSDELLAETHALLTRETRTYDWTLACVPVLSPFLAFSTYEGVARETRAVIEWFDRQNAWFSADGNLYEIEILTPLVTGVVMPTLAVALATLAATTISTLRQRQLDVREALNAELCELALLRATVLAIDDDALVAALTLLRDYASRLILECRPGEPAMERLAIADNELVDLAALFHRLNSKHSNALLGGTAQPLIQSLSGRRAKRLAEFDATYPFTHYLVLVLCSVAIAVDYLLESDQEILRFLDAVQLRILWAILIGVFASLASLITDLSDIYRGAFRLTPVVAQLFPLRSNIVLDICQRQPVEDGDSPEGEGPLDLRVVVVAPPSREEEKVQQSRRHDDERAEVDDEAPVPLRRPPLRNNNNNTNTATHHDGPPKEERPRSHL